MRQPQAACHPALYKFGVRIWLLFAIEEFGEKFRCVCAASFSN
jgi:hypothetical protein